ncbi:hypothetical protein [Salinarchaeum sp. Harcht-Bsk1]|uniref:hypothetical protein n=1 Tax=Salinarchaeum sp. Harcht-Bsk1 TaxID=1333523 RepID=UPI001181BB1D|nr:hypothetical protein [Salinarchaeum sp. Harcht-Bsk1]
MSATFENPRATNTYTAVVNLPARETAILREAYESVGEPEPQEGVTLSHNAAVVDWLRSVLRGEVSPDDVQASEPEAIDSDAYWPVEMTVTRDEFAALRKANISTQSPAKSFRRNGETAQRIRLLLRNWCNGVVGE